MNYPTIPSSIEGRLNSYGALTSLLIRSSTGYIFDIDNNVFRIVALWKSHIDICFVGCNLTSFKLGTVSLLIWVWFEHLFNQIYF